jgi:Na+/H+ antiporter NhaD/arsenite permease-like protein
MSIDEPRPLRRVGGWVFGAASAAVLVLAFAPHIHVEPEQLEHMRRSLRFWTVAPFALMLGAIAISPLAAPHWWESHAHKLVVVAALSVPVLLVLATYGAAGGFELFEKAREYVSFICLLGALFIISGGICVQGSLAGTPALNTLLLTIGAVLASLVGTTGASMLLIRPLLRANEMRLRKAHVVVFFIFVVSNCGGLLTPLGDPPLFLGFLKGVPFEWTLSRLWPLWLTTNGLLLAVFAVLDKVIFEREEAVRPGSQRDTVSEHAPLRVDGLFNLLLLGGILFVVYASGRGLFHGGKAWPFGIQEGAMIGLAAVSFIGTSRTIHSMNHFVFGPIIEVAVLFAGIFITMTPALVLLNVHGASLGVTDPWHFFWATGMLSSILDNAPTYMTMSAAAAGLIGVPVEGRFLQTVLAHARGDALLVAISAGAVLMGANTYIGNGPNFMVKAVAEHRGVEMPSFFGYMAYSGAVLIPVFVLVTVIFFRG